MFQNNLKIALRSLLRNKSQSAILIGGLAIGMAACILLLQYVSFELSFDNFHSKRDNLYRVVNERIQNGKTIQKGTITYPPIGALMEKDFPEVANHTRIMPRGEIFLRHEDKVAKQEAMWFVDEHFFEIFDFKLLAKEKDKLLDAVGQIVVTRDVADQYFPSSKGDYQSVLGKTVYLQTDTNGYKIVGVAENIPANSLIKFDLLASYATYLRLAGNDADVSLTWSDFHHFIELKPGTDAKAVEAKLPAFSDRYFKGAEVSGSKEVFTLQPMKDAHLYSAGLEYEIGQTANGRAVWSLLIIAFFILIIAWINYVNLSSVRAIERAKEVGVRKVLGAERTALMAQFLTEAFLVNLFALALAWLAAVMIKPWFAANFGLESSALHFLTADNYFLPVAMLGLVLAGVAVSGIYPAWLLSSPHVSNVLKGVFQKNIGSANLRKGLVVFQFTASIALIIGTWLVSHQINFMNKQDLGVDIDQIIVVEGPKLTNFDSTFIDKMEAAKGKWLTNPHIKSTTNSDRSLADDWHGRTFGIEKTSDNPSGEKYSASYMATEYGFAETYGLKPLAGRFFRPADHNPDWAKLDKLVINEAAVKMLGYASNEAAIGQTLRAWDKQQTIVGVVPNFHELSLHHAIEPLILMPSYSLNGPLSLRVDGQDMEATIAHIQSVYQDFFPGSVFNYAFLNESYQKHYEADRRFGHILGFFTLLTILIACLGLFGLASYMTFLRTKEIGVRKVLGASTAGIVGLLSKDFLILVILSLLIASPIAWYFMKKWLQDFPNHIEISWWVFVLAGVAAIGMAFLTVSFQSIKAALANPVKSLRSE